MERKKANREKWKRTVVCERCGTEFIAYSGKAKHCEVCRAELKRERAKEWQRTHPQKTRRKCEICGRLFTVTTSSLTCSEECRKERERRLDKERRDDLKKISKPKKKKKQKVLSFDEMAKLSNKYGLTYGKLEDAIHQGKIKI